MPRTLTAREAIIELADAADIIESSISEMRDAVADAERALDALKEQRVTPSAVLCAALSAALLVFTRNRDTAAWLMTNDPQALKQARKALHAAGEKQIDPDPIDPTT